MTSAAGGPVRLNPPGRQNPVIVSLHPRCGECRAWLRRLADTIVELREWDAHVVAVAATQEDAVSLAADLPFPVAADAEGGFAARTGVAGAGVVIADQWGEVHHVAGGGDGHDLPGPAEIVDWVRFLAIQCPECQGEAL